MSKFLGKKKNPPREEFPTPLLVYHSIFFLFLFGTVFFVVVVFFFSSQPSEPVLDGNQTMHRLAGGFVLPRLNAPGGDHSFPPLI